MAAFSGLDARDFSRRWWMGRSIVRAGDVVGPCGQLSSGNSLQSCKGEREAEYHIDLYSQNCKRVVYQMRYC